METGCCGSARGHLHGANELLEETNRKERKKEKEKGKEKG